MPPRPPAADPEMLAISALSFLAEEPGRLSRFLDLTGLSPTTLRQAAGDPRFLASVLDYLVADESLLLAFAANTQVTPESIVQAAGRTTRG
jgi:hypothetical protein